MHRRNYARLACALALLGAAFISTSQAHAAWITGYYGTNNGYQSPAQIPWSKYTHVIHFSVIPNSNGTINMEWMTAADANAFVSAAHSNGKKAIISVRGDDSAANAAFLAATAPSTIATFVNNIVSFMNTYGYDGVDLDWENNINIAQYNDLFTRLHAAAPGKLIVTAMNNGNSLPSIAATSQSKIDQVNVMCYDLDYQESVAHQSWFNDANYQSSSGQRACDWTMKIFTDAGVPASKLGVGIPFYTRRWTGCTQPLTNNCTQASTILYRNLVGDPSRWQAGYQNHSSPYGSDYLAVSALNEFISYNGTASMQDAANLMKNKGYGGVMTFEVNHEYLGSQSGDARYPLSAALFNAVGGSSAGGGTTPPPSTGHTFYVSPSGSDSAAGSSAAPFKTIQKGINAASAGDAVILKDGTYGSEGVGTSGFVATFSKAGTASAPITLKAEHKWGATIDCANNCHSQFVFSNGAGYWVIQDIDFTRSYWGTFWANSSAHHLTFKGNHIHNVGNRSGESSSSGIVGFYGSASANNILFDGNVFNNIGRLSGLPAGNHDHGIYTHSQSTTIINNVFYNNTYGWGIQLSEGAGGILIANNTFAFPNPDRSGHIVFDGSTSNVTIRNNVFYKPAGLAVTGGGQSNCVIDHNIIFGPTTVTDSSCSASNNSFVDPKLVNPTSFDFHLQAGSPAIDAGVAVSADTHDFDGNTRPIGSAYDVGAYEYGGTTGGSIGGSSGGGGTDTTAPSVPSGLSATAVSSSQINLSWSASTDNVGVTGYDIYRGGTLLTTVTGTSYQNTGLSAGTSYSYQVRAKDAAGNTSALSTTASATTQASGTSANLSAGIIPTSSVAPGEGTASMLTDGDLNTNSYIGYGYGGGPQWVKLDLGQTRLINEIKLWHYYGDGRTFHDVIVQLSNDSTFASGVTTVFNNDTDNSSGQGIGSQAEYAESSAGKDLVLSAVTARYVRFWTNGNSVNTGNYYVEAQVFGSAADTTAPSVPAGLSATAVSSSQINLSWTASTDNVAVTGYNIYRCQGTGCAPIKIGTSATNSYSNTGLTASTAYTYKVDAYDTMSNTSAQSAAASATTQAVSLTPYTYWKLDDGTGTTAADSSGNNLSATLYNSPSWLSGSSCVLSGCLSFNGTSQYGKASLSLSNTSVITVAFWMKWNSFANDDRLAMEFSPNFNNSIGGFMIDPNSSSGQFEAGFAGNVGYNQVAFARPSAGVWHQYAFVFNKANPAATEVIPYVDGVAVLYTKPASSENTNTFASDVLYLMSRNGTSLFGAGTLDDVRVYPRALSASEISTLATPPDTTAPSVPQNLTATAVSSSQINLSWSASTDNVGVTGYKVYRDGAQVGTATATTYSDTGLLRSSVHTYAVAAYDAAGNTGTQSATVTAITKSNGKSISTGSRVTTTTALNARQSASITAAKIGTQPSGVLGTIVGGPTTADSYTWWQINYDSGADGWSIDPYLASMDTTSPAVGVNAEQPSPSLIASLQSQIDGLLAQIRSLTQQMVAAAARGL